MELQQRCSDANLNKRNSDVLRAFNDLSARANVAMSGGDWRAAVRTSLHAHDPRARGKFIFSSIFRRNGRRSVDFFPKFGCVSPCPCRWIARFRRSARARIAHSFTHRALAPQRAIAARIAASQNFRNTMICVRARASSPSAFCSPVGPVLFCSVVFNGAQ